MIITDLAQAIGNTPMLRVPIRNGSVELYIKLEMLNPCGSMKDRMALSMLNDLERRKRISPSATVVESSSGNTATALAMLCAIRGYKFVALMDRHSSKSKRAAVTSLGAEVQIVESDNEDLVTALRDERAEAMASDNPDTYWTEQHNNAANAVGYAGLAAELAADLQDDFDVLVSAIGTGGSLCGTAAMLKARIPKVRVVGVEPEGSIIFGGQGHNYHQSGTGTPDGATVGLVVDYDVIDEGRKVSDICAFATCRTLARQLGLMVGGSSGGAIFQALEIAHAAPRGSRIVTIACDSGAKYIDTIYDDGWLRSMGFDLSEQERRVKTLLQ
jgi:cystathionine beta-synthase